jgi:hypothetical protein
VEAVTVDMRFTRRAFLLTLLAFCVLFLITSSMLWLRTSSPSSPTTNEETHTLPKSEKNTNGKVKVLFEDRNAAFPTARLVEGKNKVKFTTPKPKKKAVKVEEEEEDAVALEKPVITTTTTTTEKPKEQQEQSKQTKLPTIFVSIASFRDAHCSQTLNDLIDNAEHLDRIYVGIVQQNNIVDPDCVSISSVDTIKDTTRLEQFIKFRDHIRVKRVTDTVCFKFTSTF